jgi:Citrate lyase beta subunit
MQHNQFNSIFEFVYDPIMFNRYTDKQTLQYCMGGTLYMPGTKDFAERILNKQLDGLTSMVMCFEDAIKEEDVFTAEENAIRFLNLISDELNKGSISLNDIPLIFFRVRNIEQFIRFSKRIEKKHVRVFAGFNFPKFNTTDGDLYFKHLRYLNDQFGEIIYGMPILEGREIAFKETRTEELNGVKAILDQYKDIVLNVRVGATDFSSCFGVRRGIDYTIYDILTVRDCLQDVLNYFTRDNDYTVSGPVWEYFRVDKAMKFRDIPQRSMNNSLLTRIPIINEAVDGLLRELVLDRANGFIGKTIIHPTHLRYVNAMLAVTREEFEDALQILSVSGGAVKSRNANKMNEIKPHRSWAERIYCRAEVYGVIEDETHYITMFLS